MKEIEQLAHTAGETYSYIRQFLKNETELIELKALKKVCRVSGALLFRMSSVFFFLLAFIFLSITGAIALGNLLNSTVKGFGLITLFYFFCLFLLIVFQNPVKRLFGSEILQAIFEKKDDKDEKE